MQAPFLEFAKSYNFATMRVAMSYFYDRLLAHIESLTPRLTLGRLHYLSEIPTGHFSQWKSGKRKPSDNELRKLAAVDELGLSLSILQAWKTIDEYGVETIFSGIRTLCEQDPKRVNEIHELLRDLPHAP